MNAEFVFKQKKLQSTQYEYVVMAKHFHAYFNPKEHFVKKLKSCIIKLVAGIVSGYHFIRSSEVNSR